MTPSEAELLVRLQAVLGSARELRAALGALDSDDLRALSRHGFGWAYRSSLDARTRELIEETITRIREMSDGNTTE